MCTLSTLTSSLERINHPVYITINMDASSIPRICKYHLRTYAELLRFLIYPLNVAEIVDRKRASPSRR